MPDTGERYAAGAAGGDACAPSNRILCSAEKLLKGNISLFILLLLSIGPF